MSDRSGEQPRPTLPRGIALTVLIIVIVLIGIVLAAQFIPTAKRPTFVPTTPLQTITVTTTPSATS